MELNYLVFILILLNYFSVCITTYLIFCPLNPVTFNTCSNQTNIPKKLFRPNNNITADSNSKEPKDIIIEKEFVIVYNTYFTTRERRHIFKEQIKPVCLHENSSVNQITWFVKERAPSNPFHSQFPTDFDALVAKGVKDANLDTLVTVDKLCFLKCNGTTVDGKAWNVKNVIPNNKLARDLLSFNLPPPPSGRMIKDTTTKGLCIRKSLSYPLFWSAIDRSRHQAPPINRPNRFRGQSNHNNFQRKRKQNTNNLNGKVATEQRISHLLGADVLWKLGVTGKGVRVGIFDTGITSSRQSHFNQGNVKDITDWTYEQDFTVLDNFQKNEYPNNLLVKTPFKQNISFGNDYEHDLEPTDTDKKDANSPLKRRRLSSFHSDINGDKISRKVAGIDTLGHGTFVASVVGGTFKDCPGLAPHAEIYIFRVFTDSQISYTSWYLDAFNYAIIKKIHVLNLSIGGPDFLDHPFLDKVHEMSANGMIMVSSIGNDGPIAGSLNNPADMIDVIGVGAITTSTTIVSPQHGSFNFNDGTLSIQQALKRAPNSNNNLVLDKLALFSSRGMTTWELPYGYGRVKPDIVTHGIVYGADLNGGCKILSGTSVASPVVTGAVALLLGAILDYQNKTTHGKYTSPSMVNVALIKQVLMAGASRIPGISMFDQGFGRMNLVKSFQVLKAYALHEVEQRGRGKNKSTILLSGFTNTSQSGFSNFLIPTLSPPYLDAAGASDCPYMWPYCSQPIYLTSQPLILNVTLLNPVGLISSLINKPTWHPYARENGKYLDVRVSQMSPVFWPYSGWIALKVFVNPQLASPFWEGISAGQLNFTIRSYSLQSGREYAHNLTFPLRVKIVRKPIREKRILWDQFHNLNYPPGYCPRDNLLHKEEPMDWNGDHLHTNFRTLYNRLRKLGYFIEILSLPYTCFDAKNYGALLLIDPEEEFWPEEIDKIKSDVEIDGLSLIVVADWYNVSVMNQIKFYDENTRHWWVPDTGGSNVPALNDLLTSNWNITLGDTVLEGYFSLGKHHLHYASGTHLIRFPFDQSFVYVPTLKDQGSLILSEGNGEQKKIKNSRKLIHSSLPVLGLYQTNAARAENSTPYSNMSSLPQHKSGRIIVYGDSNCLDSLRMTKDCFSLMEDLLIYAMRNKLSTDLNTSHDNKNYHKYFGNSSIPPDYSRIPRRLKGNKLYRYSKILNNDYFINEHANHHPRVKRKETSFSKTTATGEFTQTSFDHPDKNLHKLPPKNSSLSLSNINEYDSADKLPRKPLPHCLEGLSEKAFFRPVQGRPLEYKFVYHLSRLKNGFASFLTPPPSHQEMDSKGDQGEIPPFLIHEGANKRLYDAARTELNTLLEQHPPMIKVANREKLDDKVLALLNKLPSPSSSIVQQQNVSSYHDDEEEEEIESLSGSSSPLIQLLRAYFYIPSSSSVKQNTFVEEEGAEGKGTKISSSSFTFFNFFLKSLRFFSVTVCVYFVVSFVWNKLPRVLATLSRTITSWLGKLRVYKSQLDLRKSSIHNNSVAASRNSGMKESNANTTTFYKLVKSNSNNNATIHHSNQQQQHSSTGSPTHKKSKRKK